MGAPPVELVSSGPYAHSRNPMFLGVLVATIGEGLFFSSAVAVGLTVVIWLLFDCAVVSWEERQNSRALGDACDRYCEQVPRWLGPL